MTEMTLAELRPGMIFDSPSEFLKPGEEHYIETPWRILFKPEPGSLHPNLDCEPIRPNPLGNLWYSHQIGKQECFLFCFDMIWDNDRRYHFREPKEHEKHKTQSYPKA